MEDIRIYRDTDIVRGKTDNSMRATASVYYDGTSATECMTDQPYGVPTIERIMKGAWDQCDMSDVIATEGHNTDTGYIARTPETLQLYRSDKGLDFELEYIDIQASREAKVKIDKKILRGCSFIATPDWDTVKITRENGKRVATIYRMKRLKEVTVCLKGGYGGATITRSQDWYQSLEEKQLKQIKGQELLAMIRNRQQIKI